MDSYLIIARSITYAQRMSVVLERAGVSSRIYRAPAGLTERGCAYALRIRVKDLAYPLALLQQAGLRPVKIFYDANGFYEAVNI